MFQIVLSLYVILTGVWGEGAGWAVKGGAGDGLSCGEETKRI